MANHGRSHSLRFAAGPGGVHYHSDAAVKTNRRHYSGPVDSRRKLAKAATARHRGRPQAPFSSGFESLWSGKFNNDSGKFASNLGGLVRSLRANRSVELLVCRELVTNTAAKIINSPGPHSTRVQP
ncbi:hypothetical protein EVAR_85272_1 [Eumeta japonica]|uniref:Uncharacterized protein n=1 Tax=Eumeta variegata TaxID=151549 RepID=A0A4C1V8C4_EUMVA|nr:hypothetical protein EVAR_85272_1 [Eumeta japonica]